MRVPATAQGMRAAIQQAETGSNCAHVQKAFRALLRGSGTLRGLKLAIQQTEKDTGTRHIQVRRAFNSMRTQHLAAGANKIRSSEVVELQKDRSTEVVELQEKYPTKTNDEATFVSVVLTIPIRNRPNTTNPYTSVDIKLDIIGLQDNDPTVWLQILSPDWVRKVNTDILNIHFQVNTNMIDFDKMTLLQIVQVLVDTLTNDPPFEYYPQNPQNQLQHIQHIQDEDEEKECETDPPGAPQSQPQPQSQSQPQPEHQQGFCNKWCLCSS